VSETVIWAQDLKGTGITVNAVLPGGATLTGMIPDNVGDALRVKLLAPEVIVPPLMWLTSDAANDVSGMRFDAARWRDGMEGDDVASLLGGSL